MSSSPMFGRFASPRNPSSSVQERPNNRFPVNTYAASESPRRTRSRSPSGRTTSTSASVGNPPYASPHRVRSPSPQRSVASVSTSVTGRSSSPWEDRLRNMPKEPKTDRSKMIVQQFAAEVANDDGFAKQVITPHPKDSAPIREAKRDLGSIAHNWLTAERDALRFVRDIERQIESAREAIKNVNSQIEEKERTIHAVTGMTVQLLGRLEEIEAEARHQGVQWARPERPFPLHAAVASPLSASSSVSQSPMYTSRGAVRGGDDNASVLSDHSLSSRLSGARSLLSENSSVQGSQRQRSIASNQKHKIEAGVLDIDEESVMSKAEKSLASIRSAITVDSQVRTAPPVPRPVTPSTGDGNQGNRGVQAQSQGASPFNRRPSRGGDRQPPAEVIISSSGSISAEGARRDHIVYEEEQRLTPHYMLPINRSDDDRGYYQDIHERSENDYGYHHHHQQQPQEGYTSTDVAALSAGAPRPRNSTSAVFGAIDGQAESQSNQIGAPASLGEDHMANSEGHHSTPHYMQPINRSADDQNYYQHINERRGSRFEDHEQFYQQQPGNGYAADFTDNAEYAPRGGSAARPRNSISAVFGAVDGLPERSIPHSPVNSRMGDQGSVGSSSRQSASNRARPQSASSASRNAELVRTSSSQSFASEAQTSTFYNNSLNIANVRIFYERFRSVIFPSNSRGSNSFPAAASISSAHVSLAKQAIERFAVGPNIVRLNLQSLEAMILDVPLLVGMSNQDPYTRSIFSSSIDPPGNWLQRVAKEVFGVQLSMPEAKSVIACLMTCGNDMPIDPQELPSYWTRIISMASLTIPLAGSKAAGIRQVENEPGGGRSLSAGRPRKEIGDLTRPHRRGSMLRMEQGWNNGVARSGSRRSSFGNVFTTAIREDQRRADLEESLLRHMDSFQSQDGLGNSGEWEEGGTSEGGYQTSNLRMSQDPNIPQDFKKFVQGVRTQMDVNVIRPRDARIELQRIFPHGFVDGLADVRRVLAVVGRKETAAADVIRVRRFLEYRSAQRGESKLRWADFVEYLEAM